MKKTKKGGDNGMTTNLTATFMAVVALGVFAFAPVADARGKDRARECPTDNRCR
jgi:hypothetical protein